MTKSTKAQPQIGGRGLLNHLQELGWLGELDRRIGVNSVTHYIDGHTEHGMDISRLHILYTHANNGYKYCGLCNTEDT